MILYIYVQMNSVQSLEEACVHHVCNSIIHSSYSVGRIPCPWADEWNIGLSERSKIYSLYGPCEHYSKWNESFIGGMCGHIYLSHLE